jgi:PhzF family phenazine biosynthesis protein
MPTLRVFQVDAFTAERFTGNPAGVVLGLQGPLEPGQLTPAQMQALARELGNGDTAFLFAPDGDDHDLQVRFFTPRTEAAFVGHATIAAHAVLAARGLPARPRQKQRSGLARIAVMHGGSVPRIAIEQSAPALRREPATAELAAVLEALRLDPNDLDPRCPPTIAGESSTRLLLGVRDGGVLSGLHPDLATLAALSERIGAPGYFLFTQSPILSGCDTEARMFCPALGISEDPVSGNAHGMLGAYLLRHGLLTPSAGHAGFVGAQGHHMNRPGKVAVELTIAASGVLASVRIAGDAVIVFETAVTF